MDGFNWLSIISLVACLVLAGSALKSHRMSLKKGVTLVLTWAAIFAAVTVLITAFRG